MKTIEIIIDAKGEVNIQTKGFTGSSCRQASKALEQALGLVTSDAPTAEMHQSQNAGAHIQTGNG